MLHTLSLDFRHLPERAGYAVRALLELQGTPRTDATRVPLRLSLVLDRSGSMAGEPLEAATRAAADVVRRLAPEDVVSVVAFNDGVRTLVPPHRGGEQSDVSARILAIQPGGRTNLSGGWLRGRELVAPDRTDGALHRVLLLTDGIANAGITDHGALAAMAAEARQHGISTTCVGFGEEYDEALLRAMADAGGGNAFHIEHADQAALAFGDELSGLQTLAGQNLAVTVALGADVTLAHAHSDWPLVDAPEGRTFEMGDLYAREPKRLLIEFFCAVAPSPRAMHPIATLTLRADVREPDGSLVHETITLPVAATLAGAGMQEPVIEREVLLSEAAQARAAAAKLVREGEAEAAVRRLRDVRETIAGSAHAAGLDAEIRDLEQLELKFVREQLDERDARYLMQRSYNSRRGKASFDAAFRRSSPFEQEPPSGTPRPRTPRKPKP